MTHEEKAAEIRNRFWNNEDASMEDAILEGINYATSQETKRIIGVIEEKNKNIPIELMQDCVSMNFSFKEGYQTGLSDIIKSIQAEEV